MFQQKNVPRLEIIVWPAHTLSKRKNMMDRYAKKLNDLHLRRINSTA